MDALACLELIVMNGLGEWDQGKQAALRAKCSHLKHNLIVSLYQSQSRQSKETRDLY